MEITLEKIELVKDRTGVTYKEAKEALEAAEGRPRQLRDGRITARRRLDASSALFRCFGLSGSPAPGCQTPGHRKSPGG